jgi:hypothetical protein
LPYVQHAIRKGRQAGLSGKPPFRYGFLGNWFVRAMDENGAIKFRAPRMYMPPASHFHAADLAADFSYLQQQFKICLEESSGLDLAKIRVTTAVAKQSRSVPDKNSRSSLRMNAATYIKHTGYAAASLSVKLTSG